MPTRCRKDTPEEPQVGASDSNCDNTIAKTVRDGLGVDQIMSQVKLVNARGELVEVETEFEAVVKIFGVSVLPSNESVLGSRVDHLMLKLVAVAGVQDLEVKGAEWSRDFMQRF
ncbi:hypothetical protein CHU98_g10704 [Xylaria longipes]|nr:hypothetical protein CHU98_g10704 [Xylaria longipes]